MSDRPNGRHRSTELLRWVTIATMLAIVGCQSASPTPLTSTAPTGSTPSIAAVGSPSVRPSTPSAGPAALGLDWGRADFVDRPGNFLQTVPPDYLSNHPILRIPGQAIPTDVVALADGGFVAVGYVPPDFQPIAWTSADGRRWSIHAMTSTDFTFPVALATRGPGEGVVAVGRSGASPLAWTSSDGTAWTPHDVAILGDGSVAERMTTVIATDDGYLAGGSVGPETLDRRARFWTSPDGATWTPVADDAAAFANAEPRAIARLAGAFVAVGVAGNVQQPSGAVGWTSPDGTHWTRIDDPSFAGGLAVAATESPFGGVVAVGSSIGRKEAIVWRSPDGRTWSRTGGGPSFDDPGFVWMTDVAAIENDLVAVGDFQPNQRGTAVSWVSRDGTTWVRGDPAPVQEQAEFYALAAGGPGAVAIGAFGLPDSFVPTFYFTPGR